MFEAKWASKPLLPRKITSLPFQIEEVAFDMIDKTAAAQKYQKLFERGILTWDEVAEAFAEHQLGDPVPYIGTREATLKIEDGHLRVKALRQLFDKD